MAEREGASTQDKLFVAGVEHTPGSTIVTYGRPSEGATRRVEVPHDYPFMGFGATTLKRAGLNTDLAARLRELKAKDPKEEQSLAKTAKRLEEIRHDSSYFVAKTVTGQEDY